MCILTRGEILREIEAGNIRIEPFDPGAIGPASVDLHLGSAFRIFKSIRKSVKVSTSSDYRDLSTKVEVGEGGFMLLMPGETLLGITEEKITLAPHLCGWLEGRSRFSRIGLLVHISASFMQPGIDNHQVLEMSNFGPNPLELYPGTPVCQFIFQRAVGEATYAGSFRGQTLEHW